MTISISDLVYADRLPLFNYAFLGRMNCIWVINHDFLWAEKEATVDMFPAGDWKMESLGKGYYLF